MYKTSIMVPAFCLSAIAKRRKAPQGGSASVPLPLLGSLPGVLGDIFPFRSGVCHARLGTLYHRKAAFSVVKCPTERRMADDI